MTPTENTYESFSTKKESIVDETRQVRRAKERGSEKMPPAEIARTSSRWMGRNKGQPYSRQKIVRIVPAQYGVPAVFHTRSFTRNKASKPVIATARTIDWFFPSLPDNLKQSMLGA